MDKNFIINQVITAVLVIITTYVTVRLTTRVKTDPTDSAIAKLRRASRKYGRIAIRAMWAVFCLGWLIFFLWPRPTPVNRFFVFMIVIYTYFTVYWATELTHAIVDYHYDKKKPPGSL